MPITNLTFNNNINVSVQIGDIIYYTSTTTQGVHDTANNVIELGVVIGITGNTITVDYPTGVNPPAPGQFIMFAKDRRANMSSLLGYYAEFRIKNNSTNKAEMYSISVDVTESSK